MHHPQDFYMIFLVKIGLNMHICVKNLKKAKFLDKTYVIPFSRMGLAFKFQLI